MLAKTQFMHTAGQHDRHDRPWQVLPILNNRTAETPARDSFLSLHYV